jgi:hypothetical protein
VIIDLVIVLSKTSYAKKEIRSAHQPELLGLPISPPWRNDRAVPHGRFTVDGRSVLLVQDGSIARWPVPAPMEGTRERIRLAIEVATRHTLDPDGGVGWLGSGWSPDPKDPRKAVPTKDPWPAAR